MININNYNNNNVTNFFTTNSKETSTFSFATHNVNSLQCELKNHLINDTFIDFNTDFVGLTETRHKIDQFYQYTRDPNFCAFWSTRINTYAGVSILVKRT